MPARSSNHNGRRPGVTSATLAGAYVGSVIGAGFASGQEHTAFFLRFGVDGLWGLGVAGLMFVLFGAALLVLAHRHKTRSHVELLQVIASPPVATLFDWLLTASLLVSLSVMMAGGGALLHTLLGIPKLAGALGMALITLAVVILRVDAMLRANAVLTVVLTTFIAWLGIASAPQAVESGWPQILAHQGWAPSSWLASAVSYGAYNLALTLTLFGALGGEIRDEREAVIGGASGGALLFLLGLCVCFAVAASLAGLPGQSGSERGGEGTEERPMAQVGELPMLPAAARRGPAVEAAYAVALGLAMLTTSVASAYALARRLAGTGLSSHRAAAVVAVGAAFPFSALGFGELVATLYPVIGYVGSGCLGLTALLWLRSATKRRGA